MKDIKSRQAAIDEAIATATTRRDAVGTSEGMYATHANEIIALRTVSAALLIQKTIILKQAAGIYSGVEHPSINLASHNDQDFLSLNDVCACRFNVQYFLIPNFF